MNQGRFKQYRTGKNFASLTKAKIKGDTGKFASKTVKKKKDNPNQKTLFK